MFWRRGYLCDMITDGEYLVTGKIGMGVSMIGQFAQMSGR